MMRSLRVSLLIASMLVVLGTTSSQACHRRRSCQPIQATAKRGTPTGLHGLLPVARAATPRLTAGYYGGGYAGGTAGYPGGYGQPGTGYDFGRPGYNPGGLGGPASGIGVRPGLGAGGFGPGR